MFLGLVVSGQAVNLGLNQNQSEFRVSILAVLVQVAANVDGFLDEVIEILRELGGETGGLKDTKDLGASHRANLGNTHRITEDNTDLRGGHTLLGILGDLLLDLLGLGLAPRRRSPAIRERRTGNTLTGMENKQRGL